MSAAFGDSLRRAVWSFIQQFAVVAFVGLGAGVTLDTLRSVPWYAAAGTGVFAAALSLAMSFLSWKVPVLPFWEDWGLRVGKTFVQSIVATMAGTVVWNAFDASFIDALAVAAGVAAVVVVKQGLILEALAHLGVGPRDPANVRVAEQRGQFGYVPMEGHAGK